MLPRSSAPSTRRWRSSESRRMSGSVVTRIPSDPFAVWLNTMHGNSRYVKSSLSRFPGLPGDAAEGQERHSLPAGDDLPLLLGAAADEGAALERPCAAVGVERGGAVEDDVHLFLALLGVVMLGEVGPAGREALDVHPPRRHAEPLAGVEELAAVVLEVVDRLDRDVAHGRVLPRFEGRC